MTKDEALKLALEALENAEDQLAKPYSTGARYAITAIREALAEQEQRWTEFNETTKKNIEHAEWYLSTHPAQQQEPVAYGLFVNGELSWDSEWAFSNESFPVQYDDEECRPLYTSPPASKPWVGLTKLEVGDFKGGYQSGRIGSFVSLVAAIEAKLKEKNA